MLCWICSMSSRFSIYDPPSPSRQDSIESVEGSASSKDSLFVNNLLSSLVNKQSALFQHWLRARVTSPGNDGNDGNDGNEDKKQLLVLTPLKIISLPTNQSPKRMKQFRIIDVVSLFVEENSNFKLSKMSHLNVQQNQNKMRKPKTKKKRKIKMKNNSSSQSTSSHSLPPPPSASLEQQSLDDHFAKDESVSMQSMPSHSQQSRTV